MSVPSFQASAVITDKNLNENILTPPASNSWVNFQERFALSTRKFVLGRSYSCMETSRYLAAPLMTQHFASCIERANSDWFTCLVGGVHKNVPEVSLTFSFFVRTEQFRELVTVSIQQNWTIFFCWTHIVLWVRKSSEVGNRNDSWAQWNVRNWNSRFWWYETRIL